MKENDRQPSLELVSLENGTLSKSTSQDSLPFSAVYSHDKSLSQSSHSLMNDEREQTTLRVLIYTTCYNVIDG
jgi:hypothetical protein